MAKAIVLAVAASCLRITTSSPSLVVSALSTMSFFQPSANLRGVFVGSGSDGMSDPRIANLILELTSLQPSKVRVLYLGTATYDLPMFQKRQTQRFLDLGCTVTVLDVALKDSTSVAVDDSNKEIIDRANVIVVGGGNTLYAMDRWAHLGITQYLFAAMKRGAILTGGSAGAICWFEGGHSDSMDPDTYKKPMLEKYGSNHSQTSVQAEESSTLEEGTVKEWKYMRVHGLGFLPGLVCPHHDKVQSNGVLRANDFDQMLLKHPGELGIGIDHWAALVVEGEEYRVVSLEGKSGSVHPNGVDFCPNDDGGLPGIWIKKVGQDGKVHSRVCPKQGKVKDLLQHASEIVEATEDVERCRKGNPSGYLK